MPSLRCSAGVVLGCEQQGTNLKLGMPPNHRLLRDGLEFQSNMGHECHAINSANLISYSHSSTFFSVEDALQTVPRSETSSDTPPLRLWRMGHSRSACRYNLGVETGAQHHLNDPCFFKVTTGSSSWLPMFCAQEHCIWYVLGALFLVETLHQATKVVLQLWQVHQKKTNIVPPNWDNVLQNHSQQLARVNSQLTWEGSVMTCRGVNNWLIGFPLLQESPHNL